MAEVLTAGRGTSSRKLDGAIGAVLGRSSERMEWRTRARKVRRGKAVYSVWLERALGARTRSTLTRKC